MTTTKTLTAAALLALASISSANSAIIKTDVDHCNNREKGCHMISILGTIEYGDDQKFEGELARHPDLKKAVVFLNSDGGNVVAALSIGRTIRKNKFATLAMEQCYSACAAIWVAGNYLQTTYDTKIGFHAAANVGKNGKATVASDGNAVVGAYYGMLGFSDNAIRYMTFAGPNEMKILSKGVSIHVLGLKVKYLDETPVQARCFDLADAIFEKEYSVNGNRWWIDIKNDQCRMQVLALAKNGGSLTLVNAENGNVLARFVETINKKGSQGQCQYHNNKPVACTLDAFKKEIAK